MHSLNRPIAITAGEPAGIGPDLIIQLTQLALTSNYVVIADKQLLSLRAKQLNLPIQIVDYESTLQQHPQILPVLHVPCPNIHCVAKPDVANATYVINTLTIAAQGALQGKFSAIVTAPVQKSIINAAGIHFSGHTEFLAELANIDQVVMMLQTEGLRVALATTHLPLKDVAAAITHDKLQTILNIIHKELINKFNIAKPCIYVCGLNPHAGEQGYLGREEIEVITPVIHQCQQRGMRVEGPFPADTVFTDKFVNQTHCILAMYHDQGLPVIKAKAFGEIANITLGLPFVRTSVDHGTALELAGTGKADVSSLVYALKVATNIQKY